MKCPPQRRFLKVSPWDLKEIENAVQFKIKVQARAKKNEISGFQGDALKLRLTAPPVDGEANAACIKYFARLFRVSKSAVTIMAGQTSQHKLIRVEGMDKEKVRQVLENAGYEI